MHNKAFVPMELLDIEPVRTKKITDQQRALLCLKSSLEPADYLDSVNDVRNSADQQRFEQDPFVKAWRLNVDINMLEASGRVIPGPRVIYQKTAQMTHQQGGSASVCNNTRNRFYEPTHFPPIWALINLSSSLDRNACEQFYQELSRVAVDRGINCPEPEIYEEYDAQHHSLAEIIAALKSMMRMNSDCKFFIVILPDSDSIRDRTYGEVKKLVSEIASWKNST